MNFPRRSFLKHISLGTVGLLLPPAGAKRLDPDSASLPRSTPEAQGIASKAILSFLDAVEENSFELHSFMMLRHGQVVAEGWWDPYGPEFVHTMYSMSKSFTSTAVGLAVAEGKLTVEDKVISFFPDDLPESISENLAALRVKDLLTMSVGNEKEPTQPVVRSENWVRTFLAQKLAHKPGTVFMYNSAATYMCSAIVQKVTGQTLLDYLTPRLFTPLGITGMKWESCPKGINTGGWGLSIPTEAMAKFGQLYLQKGQWHGRQILPAAWVEEATSFHIQQPGDPATGRPDWLHGYGYQFWRCQHGHYRGDGAFGQFTIVLPEHDAVIVMTSENKNMQGQLDLVWQHLLPAFKESTKSEDATLAARLDKLKLTPPSGIATSPNQKRIDGKIFSLEPNEGGFTSASFTFQQGDCLLTLKTADKTYAITCGLGRWHLGTAAIPGTPPRLISGGKPVKPEASKIAASACWKDESRLALTLRYYETPHHDTLNCQFDGDKVTLSFLSSLAAMAAKPKDARKPIKGTMA